MSVILGSEIARLVFGYLQEEQLDEAATAFCKTSPYLVEEYDWLQRGYKAYKISDLCLVDIIREHCEIKYAVAEYIESLPLSTGDTLKIQKSLSGKINSIFDLLTTSSKPNSSSRKRPYSMIGSSSTEATQPSELPGYEPPFKERRLSRKLILRQDATPKQNSVWTPTFKQNVQDVYTGDHDQDEEDISPEQANTLEKSRNETSQYPIFTETILENTQFQNVLVDNINRILETSADRIDISAESGSHEAMSNNNSLQEQVKHAIDNIIMSTEQDPTFQQVLNDVVQHTAIQEQAARTTTSSLNDTVNSSNDKTESPVPLKQRLRHRSQDKPRPNYSEIDDGSKKKRKEKVEVISNEIVSGEIRDILNPSSTVRTDSYVPLNQIVYLNPDRSTTTYGQDLVYVNVSNVGMPTFSQFRIDADTPMFLQDISLAHNGTSTSLTPGSIINLPIMDQQIQPIQSMLPNVIIKDIFEESKTKPIERSIKTTPSVSKNMAQVKSRNLTSPRRQSHVRSLNFTGDDSVNDNERMTNNRSENDHKLEPVDIGTAATSHTSRNIETQSDDSNQKTSLEDVDPQQDSSDAVDFSKEFDEATVISVEIASVQSTKSECSKEETPGDKVTSAKKKPQTRQQCQKELEMWNKMRQMKKGEWDNYLRQTVASKKGSTPMDKRNVKKKRSKIGAKSGEANVSAENGIDTTTDIQARLLEEALESAKKPVLPANENRTTPESTKEKNDVEQLKPSSSSVTSAERAVPTVERATTSVERTAISAEKSNGRNSRSPNKRSSGGRKRIQIKLPASTKKKLSMSNKRRANPTVKRAVNPHIQPQQRAAETNRIDPSQTIDIDLISPIEHPKESNNVVKSGVNLISFLETPCKESASFKFPITPGFVISSSIKTPGVRLMKDYDSLIKFPERTKTPLSQSSSQKDGSSYNRATDYSSGSSYYKPDESDDIDKNLDVLIKENRAQVMVGGLGVDPQQNINSCNDQSASDGELSDSSTSTSSSSQSSSSSNCSSSPSISPSADDNRNKAQAMSDAKKLLIAQRSRLEQIRLRTMATLQDKKIERFRKPKTKIATLQRHKVMDGSSMMKKPVQTLKMTGNSTPKVLPKHVTKVNPKSITTTPSKRKIATPRRVIYLDYKDTIKTSVRVVSHDRKSAQQLTSQSNDNAMPHTSKPLQDANRLRPVTPTETIDAIENHIAKTSQNPVVECAAKPINESQVDTPHLLQQLQGKGDVTDKASTPEMGPPATSTKRATLVRELFGEGTMSDSDFMDTPIKVTNNSRTQTNVVPVLHATEKVSVDSTTNESTVTKADPDLSKANDEALVSSNSTAPASIVLDSNSSESKAKDSTVKVDGSKSSDLLLTNSNSKEINAIEPIIEGLNVKTSVAKNSVARGSVANDSVAKSSVAKDSVARDSVLKDSISKDSVANDSISKDSVAKDSISKDSVAKDSISKDSVAKDSISKDSVAKDSISKISISKDSIVKDSLNVNAIEENAVAQDTNTKVAVAHDSTSTVSDQIPIQSITNDSHSDTDDDGDDYDDCTLISSLPISNMTNRIYHKVISETKECAIKLKAKCLDLRPLTTFMDGKKIVMKTCDEVLLFSSAPKTDSAQTITSSGAKSVIKKKTNMRTVDGVRKVEERYKKVQKLSFDGMDAVVPEKNARFNIVAKQKGPVDVPSSSHTSSSRDRRNIVMPSEEIQQNAGTSNEMNRSSQQHTKIPPLLKDMDINKVLGKIHPSKEIV